jgi:hypothetical protein
MDWLPIILASLFAGVLIGLVFGPSTERLDAANYAGWVEGYRFAFDDKLPEVVEVLRSIASLETEDDDGNGYSLTCQQLADELLPPPPMTEGDENG